MKKRGQMPNRIIRACRRDGRYPVSAGTMEPAVVLSRMLDALEVLDPEAHQTLTKPGSPISAVPLAASRDERHPWWNSLTAIALVESVILAIDRAGAPHNCALDFLGSDRFEIVLVSPTITENSNGVVDTSRPPPSISALRARVRREEVS